MFFSLFVMVGFDIWAEIVCSCIMLSCSFVKAALLAFRYVKVVSICTMMEFLIVRMSMFLSLFVMIGFNI